MKSQKEAIRILNEQLAEATKRNETLALALSNEVAAKDRLVSRLNAAHMSLRQEVEAHQQTKDVANAALALVHQLTALPKRQMGVDAAVNGGDQSVNGFRP